MEINASSSQSSIQGTSVSALPEQPTGLSGLETRVLEFERHWWKYAGAKESSIKELFDMAPPAYYQLLNNLIDRPEALLAQPMLVKRLRRLREARTTSRAAGFRL
jgi:hypothetical protein